MSKGETVIAVLNRVVEFIEEHLTEEIDVAGLTSSLGTTEYHLRRMFSSLAGMPLSEYIRRRRMTVAAADVLGDGDLLGIAVRFGYGSTEAFSRAFRAVHGVSPGDVAPGRWPPSHTTAAQVPPDRRREHHDGHPHRRSTGLPTRRPLGPRAAHPPRRQSAHPSAHRLAARSRARSPQGTEQHRAGRAAPGECRRRPRLHRGQRADLPPRRRRQRDDAGARGPRRDRGSGRHLGGVPHRGPVPGGPAVHVGRDRHRLVPLQPLAVAARPLDRGGARPRRRLQHGDLRAVAAGGTRWGARGSG